MSELCENTTVSAAALETVATPSADVAQAIPSGEDVGVSVAASETMASAAADELGENTTVSAAALETVATPSADVAQAIPEGEGVGVSVVASETVVSAAADVAHEIINSCKGDWQLAKERLHEMGMSLPSSFSNLDKAPDVACGGVAHSVLRSCGGDRAAAAEKLQEMGLLLPPPLRKRRGAGAEGRKSKQPRGPEKHDVLNFLTAESLADGALQLAPSSVCTHASTAAFVRRMRRMLAEGGSSCASVSVVFHWTPRKNFRQIDNVNVQVPGQENGVLHQTDEGFYGKGIYTSPDFDQYRGYGHGAERAFLCLGLPGRQFPAYYPEHMGVSLQSGFDSHISADDKDGPTGSQWVFFSSDQLLGLFLVDSAGVEAARAAAGMVIHHLSSHITCIPDDPGLASLPTVSSAPRASSQKSAGGNGQLRGCAFCGGSRPGWEGCPRCASAAPKSNSSSAPKIEATAHDTAGPANWATGADSSSHAECLLSSNTPKYFFRD